MKKIRIQIMLFFCLLSTSVLAQNFCLSTKCAYGKYGVEVMSIKFKGKTFKQSRKDFEGKFDMGYHNDTTIAEEKIAAGYWVYLENDELATVTEQANGNAQIKVGLGNLANLVKSPVLYVYKEQYTAEQILEHKLAEFGTEPKVDCIWHGVVNKAVGRDASASKNIDGNLTVVGRFPDDKVPNRFKNISITFPKAVGKHNFLYGIRSCSASINSSTESYITENNQQVRGGVRVVHIDEAKRLVYGYYSIELVIKGEVKIYSGSFGNVSF